MSKQRALFLKVGRQEMGIEEGGSIPNPQVSNLLVAVCIQFHWVEQWSVFDSTVRKSSLQSVPLGGTADCSQFNWAM